MITDKEIKATIQSVVRGERSSADITDPSERGGGRLRLRVRQTKSGICSEWYATWQREGKRGAAKIGNYPTVDLKTARATYRRDYLPVILKGENPVGPRAVRSRGRATVQELFEAYVEYLGDRPSAVGARQMLLGKNGAVHAIGPNKPVVAVRRSHIIPLLAEIHDRGAKAQANYMRNVIHAAFGYAIRSAGSYFDKAGATDWGLEFNPVSTIPINHDAHQPGRRALDEQEFRRFWRWLESHRGANTAFDAIRIMMATGQRPCEILSLNSRRFDQQERLVRWDKTKNGRPHAIPLPRQAFDILASLPVSATGLYFNKGHDSGRFTRTYAVARLVRRYIDETGAEPFEARDIRRTWKTLAGAAGLTKAIRDRLQNHALSDVSSRHYDMWDYMREMREGMLQWERKLDEILAVQDDEPCPAKWTAETLAALNAAMGGRAWRASAQSRHHADWVGNPVAEALGFRRVGDWRERAWLQAREMGRTGVLTRIMVRDEKHREVPAMTFSAAKAEELGLATILPIQRAGPRKSSLGAQLSPEILRALREGLGGRSWRASPQAQRHPDWVGQPIAIAFNVPKVTGWQTRCVRIAFTLVSDGVLVPTTMVDQVGRTIPALVMCQGHRAGAETAA